MSQKSVKQPLAILLGGLANTTSTARALGRQGVPVAVLARNRCAAHHSRYAKSFVIPEDTPPADYWREWLLERPEFPPGSVVFPCEDAALQFTAQAHKELSERYHLDILEPAHALALLDKEKTLTLAREAGVPAPRSWSIRKREDVEALLDSIVYPVLIKPVHTHLFQHKFGKKVFLVENEETFLSGCQKALDAGIDFMVCEFVPGPDTQLSSYYAYFDRHGEPVYELTKRTMRRSPANFGIGSYHMTEWLPETAETGRRFLKNMGFRGIANIEFKSDPRDGQLKIIECNTRFTGAQELIIRSGLNIPFIAYRYIVANERPSDTTFKEFVTLWLPFEDLDAFRDLLASGQISPWAWLKSICRGHGFCYFALDDMKPFFEVCKFEAARRANWLLGQRQSRTRALTSPRSEHAGSARKIVPQANRRL
jgi:D-aspartate ligase